MGSALREWVLLYEVGFHTGKGGVGLMCRVLRVEIGVGKGTIILKVFYVPDEDQVCI